MYEINRISGLKILTCSFCKNSVLKLEIIIRFPPLTLFCDGNGQLTHNKSKVFLSHFLYPERKGSTSEKLQRVGWRGKSRGCYHKEQVYKGRSYSVLGQGGRCPL